MKYRVTQSFSGCIDRVIEAESEEEAEAAMLSIDDVTFDELMDSNWDDPEAQIEKGGDK